MALFPFFVVDTNWMAIGDVNAIAVLPISRLDATLASLVLDDKIVIEFQFKVLQTRIQDQGRWLRLPLLSSAFH